MKKNLIIIILIIFPTLLFADGGTYLQFEAGKSQLSSGVRITAGSPTIDENSETFGLTLGLNVFDKNTFVEIGYRDFGGYSMKGTLGDSIASSFGATHNFGGEDSPKLKTHAKTKSIGVKRKMEIFDNLNISGVLGFHNFNTHHTQTGAFQTVRDSTTKKYYGLGAEYKFNNIDFIFNYAHYDIDSSIVTLEHVETITAGVQYKKLF